MPSFQVGEQVLVPAAKLAKPDQQPYALMPRTVLAKTDRSICVDDGDGGTVNVASRLQAMTKEVGESILFSAETARLATGAAHFVSCGVIEVRGKSRPLTVLRIDRDPAPAETPL